MQRPRKKECNCRSSIKCICAGYNLAYIDWDLYDEQAIKEAELEKYNYATKKVKELEKRLRLNEEEVCKVLKSVPSGSEMVDFAKAICKLQEEDNGRG